MSNSLSLYIYMEINSVLSSMCTTNAENFNTVGQILLVMNIWSYILPAKMEMGKMHLNVMFM